MTKKAKCIKPMDLSQMSLGAAPAWRRLLPLGLASSLPQMLHGENHVDYRYEYYNEDNNRMTIDTHSVYFEQQLVDQVIAKGELVYDGISGATPTGTHNLAGKVLTTHVSDIRRSVSLQFDGKLNSNNTLTPGFAYSKESDYESYGISLNHGIQFNEKNTTLQLGVSHNFDSVRNMDPTTKNEIWSNKDSTEGIIGITQLLTPKSILNVAFTFGNDSGYLSDPYRLAQYFPTDIPNWPAGFFIGVPERRPAHRNKEIIYTSLTQYFEKVDASLEGSYRFYNDSYGVVANTVGLTWNQWLGKHFIASPFVRLYEQSAADFYQVTFYGPYTTNPGGYHSSDYRLSELYTTDVGLQTTVVVNDHIHINAGYHRYEMHGLDGKTSSAMYPKANVFNIGLSFVW